MPKSQCRLYRRDIENIVTYHMGDTIAPIKAGGRARHASQVGQASGNARQIDQGTGIKASSSLLSMPPQWIGKRYGSRQEAKWRQQAL